MLLTGRRNTPRALFALSLFSLCAHAATPQAAPSLGFIDELPIRNDLIGSLQGTVKFAQTHTIDAAGNAANELPTLVAERDALVMLIPQMPIAEAEMGQVKVTARLGGSVVGERLLAPPRLLPRSDRTAHDSRPDVEYSLGAWSAQLPWEWMKPGLSLSFSHGQRSGDLTESAIEFTGPAELVLQNIRIGMLAAPVPASENWLETQTSAAAIDYFQKIPVARLTVGHYLPIHLEKVVLPNGTTYTSASADRGSVYSGDMRENIGKALISTGINLANYGIVDSAGRSQEQPEHFRQVVVHQSVGNYANGVVRHGLSGGNGMATLLSTSGNEFAHEMGHAFGLEHYPGGGRWSSHHGESGWGYDAFRNRLLGNLRWSAASASNNVEGVVTPPFKDLYRYRQDPMAGGEPDGGISALTHHTGYSLKRVQQAMVGSSQIDAASPTGYSRWDAARGALVPVADRKKPAQFGVPVVTLVGLYDPQGQLPTTMYPPLYGNHGYTYDLPAPPAGGGCYLKVWSDAGEGRAAKPVAIQLAAQRYSAGEMNKFHVNLAASSQPSRAKLYCSVANQERMLAELSIEKPVQALPQAVHIGKENGYQHAALQLPTILASVPGRFTRTDEFEQRLRNVYGDINRWSDNRSGRVGAFYVYENRYTGFREYFMLKKPRYGYYPINGTSNDDWRYMGRAEDSVTWTPEPLRAMATPGASLTEKLLAYYRVDAIKGWVQNDTTPKHGQIYQYHNPYTKTHEFFMARSSKYGYFPTHGGSNKDWIYLGSAESLNAVFFPRDAQTFERQIAEWHRQDGLRSWNGATTTGVIGEIYRYPHQGRIDYFRLKVVSYWYFPTNKTSNYWWEYVGSMP
ncbi:hypothetical protein GCM10017655_35610 [Pseudomonas turukhanskensis]|uniref:Peptidase M66 domain-containing protein n=2 Tax=Pseudomonas turukhanskensis TaxID=1806536 RepID=A0A9W6K807_9PSED|nr:hypothetical protein GCM10017655_35610 [Pseudomonas turukhanskensis]